MHGKVTVRLFSDNKVTFSTNKVNKNDTLLSLRLCYICDRVRIKKRDFLMHFDKYLLMHG